MLKRTLNLCFILELLSLMNACKEPDTIGLGVLPAKDQLNVEYYNANLTAYSKLEDSIRSDETAYNLLGLNYDPVFGKNLASFYTQLHLAIDNTTFGSQPVLDSIVLTLAYHAIYGDTNAKQTVKVYELASNIYADSNYYSNRDLLTTGTVIGSKKFVPDKRDSIRLLGSDTTKYPGHLRIRLDSVWGTNKFLNASSSSLLNNTNFIQYFKGIYVTSTSSTGEGSIMSFNLLSSLSKISIYYKHSDDGDTIQHTYNMVIDENCARINHFNHSKYKYATQYLQHQIYGDTLKGDSILFLQSMAGLQVRIDYPELKQIAQNGKIAINKATFIVDVDENDYPQGSYTPPAQLVLIEELNGKIRFLQDEYDGLTYFGGTYDANLKEYKFNIARHIQQIVDGVKDNLGLYLVVWTGDRPNTANRVVLKGPKRKSGNMRLQITYTKLY